MLRELKNNNDHFNAMTIVNSYAFSQNNHNSPSVTFPTPNITSVKFVNKLIKKLTKILSINK